MRKILIMLALLLLSGTAYAQTINWQAFTSGAQISSGSGQVLRSFIGQPTASGYSGFGVYQGQTRLSVTDNPSQPAGTAKPLRYQLDQNYPNPFNPSTGIRYQVPGVSDVRLEVFDVLGRKVSTLVNERQVAGAYSVNFNAASLASGIYFYRIEVRSSGSQARSQNSQSGSFTETKRMMLVK
jgi:hypothetical protein